MMLKNLYALFFFTVLTNISTMISSAQNQCDVVQVNRMVTEPGCDPVNVLMNACWGACSSYSLSLPSTPWWENACRCCRIKHSKSKAVELNCANGIKKIKYLQEPTRCSCTKCPAG